MQVNTNRVPTARSVQSGCSLRLCLTFMAGESIVGTLGSDLPSLALTMHTTATLGRWAEQRALRLLQQRGWRLLDRNWRCRWGELDLVLCKPQRLLVVEVKGRSSLGRDGGGVAALRQAKRQRLAWSCQCWLAEQPLHQCDQLELVAALVSLPPQRRPIRWIRLNDWSSASAVLDRCR
jgi:putative endonuclease